MVMPDRASAARSGEVLVTARTLSGQRKSRGPASAIVYATTWYLGADYMQGNTSARFRGYGGECRDSITSSVLLRNNRQWVLLDVIMIHVRTLEAEHS
jgi:hypothetical protein